MSALDRDVRMAHLTNALECTFGDPFIPRRQVLLMVRNLSQKVCIIAETLIYSPYKVTIPPDFSSRCRLPIYKRSNEIDVDAH
jgi:hypothetical protein